METGRLLAELVLNVSTLEKIKRWLPYASITGRKKYNSAQISSFFWLRILKNR